MALNAFINNNSHLAHVLLSAKINSSNFIGKLENRRVINEWKVYMGHDDNNLFPPNMPLNRKFLLDNEKRNEILISKDEYIKRLKIRNPKRTRSLSGSETAASAARTFRECIRTGLM